MDSPLRCARLPAVALAITVAGCAGCDKVARLAFGDDPHARASSTATSSAPGDLSSTLPAQASAHPRLFLTPDRLAAIAKLKASGSPAWKRLAEDCDASVSETRSSGYEAWDWANSALSLAICFRVTKDPRYADAAVKYFVALLDDHEHVGDGLGGDKVVHHDDGYSIRSHGALGAIAYDWLDGFPKMTPAIKTKAMDRFVVWTKWFGQKGWNHDEPISNYYMGWFGTAAFGALAAAGEDPRAADLRALTAKLWNDGIVPSYRDKLAGGDFPEGWQYGDNVLAMLALYCDAERTAGGTGKRLETELPWLAETTTYRLHALTPDGVHTYDSADWEDHPPVAPPHGLEAVAMLLGTGDPAGRRAAALAALARQGVGDADDWRWLAVLTPSVPKPSEDVRSGPTSYLAPGTAMVFARTDWTNRAVWLSFTSAPQISDHQHLDAGHFEIVRGADRLVVDSGDDGALSGMSHNVILVDDHDEIMAYTPNQGTWGKGAKIARFEDDGATVYAMADYPTAYDGANTEDTGKRAVTRADREVVFARGAGGAGETARVVIYDRMTLRKASYQTTFVLHGGARPELAGARATVRVGESQAVATRLLPEGADARLVREPTPPRRDRPYFNNQPPDGVKSQRLEEASPRVGATKERRFLHVIAVGASSDPPGPTPELRQSDTMDGAIVGQDAYAFVAAGAQPPPAPVALVVPAGTLHVMVIGLAPSQSYAVSSNRVGDGCALAIGPGAGSAVSAAGTMTVRLDAACAIAH
jgi:hypothetical protein